MDSKSEQLVKAAKEIDPTATTIVSAMAGFPIPVQKRYTTAIGRLLSAPLNWVSGRIENKIAEEKAESEARICLLESQAAKIAEAAGAPPHLVEKARSRFEARVLREERNLNAIGKMTTQLMLEKASTFEKKEEETDEPSGPGEEINPDWMNRFEEEGRLKTSDEMRLMFARILTQEILAPNSVSEKTLKIVSTLDQNAARLFQKFCSYATAIVDPKYIHDARVIVFSGRAGSNALEQYGFPYPKLASLAEYGLLRSEYDTQIDYEPVISDGQSPMAATLLHQGEYYILRRVDEAKGKGIKALGPSLSYSGMELFSIVELGTCESYTEELKTHVKDQGFEMVIVTTNQTLGSRALPI